MYSHIALENDEKEVGRFVWSCLALRLSPYLHLTETARLDEPKQWIV